MFGSTSALGGGAYADRMLQSWGMRGRLGILILFTASSFHIRLVQLKSTMIKPSQTMASEKLAKTRNIYVC